MRLLVFFAFALTLSAADLSGIWSGTLIDRNGDVQDVSFRFSQTGDVLTGKLYGDNESTLISDGKITGDQITFAVTAELNGQITKFVYTGTFVIETAKDGANAADEMRLTRQRLGGNNAGAKSKGQNQRQSITLKRVA